MKLLAELKRGLHMMSKETWSMIINAAVVILVIFFLISGVSIKQYKDAGVTCYYNRNAISCLRDPGAIIIDTSAPHAPAMKNK